MRALCNIAYVAQVEGLDRDGLRAFDRELVAEPGSEPRGHSTNVQGLMASFGLPKAGG